VGKFGFWIKNGKQDFQTNVYAIVIITCTSQLCDSIRISFGVDEHDRHARCLIFESEYAKCERFHIFNQL
jgi:hypothetical protein